MKKLISIIIPAYNEADNLLVIIDRLERVLDKTAYLAEFIIVDDGSQDKTIEMLRTMATIKPNLFYIELSRNFGHQQALRAGLNLANGDCAISLDADLQHPPELITAMLKKWENGYEVVYTRRMENAKSPFVKRKSSVYFYKLLNLLSNINIEEGAADFRLLDRKVLNIFRSFEENEPFIRGLVKWMGYRQTGIDYLPGKRYSGASKYGIKKMIQLGLQGVTSFSIKPLYLAVYLGFTLSAFSVLYIPYIFFAFLQGIEVNGWASIIITIVFFGGLQLIILGIIGIYVGKMFIQSKHRPNYIIRSTNLTNDHGTA